MRIQPGLVKIPDVSFVSWDRWPKIAPPRRPIPSIVPDLAIEVLFESKTPREMEQKLSKYIGAGVRLVWYINPATRSAVAYCGETDFINVAPNGNLVADSVLPGFELSLQEVFDEADRQGPRDASLRW